MISSITSQRADAAAARMWTFLTQCYAHFRLDAPSGFKLQASRQLSRLSHYISVSVFSRLDVCVPGLSERVLIGPETLDIRNARCVHPKASSLDGRSNHGAPTVSFCHHFEVSDCDVTGSLAWECSLIGDVALTHDVCDTSQARGLSMGTLERASRRQAHMGGWSIGR